MKSEPVLTLGLRTGRGRVSARALRTFAQWLMRQIPDFEPDRWAAISIVVTGDEDIAATTKRHPARISARLGARRDGRLLAMEFDADFNTGAYAS